MDDAERIAVELRKIRRCGAGEVPCPFCSWSNDPDTTEMGCVWMAEQLIASGVLKVSIVRRQRKAFVIDDDQ